MSSIKLSPNASGTGIFTVAAPNSNTDRTLTLPDATGTFNVSGLVNEVPAGSASAPSIYPTGDSNTGIFFPAADTIAFSEGGVEAARIDSSGNLLVGTTSPLSNVSGFQVSYNPGVSKYAGAVVNTKTDNSTVTNGFLVKYTGVSPSDGNYIFLCQDAGNTNRFFVTNAGGTGGTSDVNLKKNIETTRNGYVDDLCKIRIVKYNWKTQDDDAPKYLGWIAQEVEEVFPRMVETDAETGFKSVTYSPFVPMLIKAIQELKAEVDALKAQLGAQA